MSIIRRAARVPCLRAPVTSTLSRMTHSHDEIESWVQALVREAGRDIVFLWNIEKGSFGGSGKRPDATTLKQVIAGLVRHGCMVGFGDPSLEGWQVPPELNVAPDDLPDRIIALRKQKPADYEFVVFALRDESELQRHNMPIDTDPQQTKADLPQVLVVRSSSR